MHILCDLHPSICLADLVKEIKIGSGNWIKESGWFPSFSGWQNGYGVFTYNIKERPLIIAYIKNQKKHHRHETFYDEYKRILLENGVVFEEKYLL